MTLARPPISRVPRFSGGASLVAIGSIVGVPMLAACFPRWALRLALPLLGITSAGIYLTVPDTERVSLVMAIVVLATIVCFVASIEPHRLLVAVAAFVIMGAAILDSGGRAAAIARAAGCFGVLVAAPVAGWLNELRGDGERRAPPVALVVVHCLVVGWSSRVLIREVSLVHVIPAVAGALIVATGLLLATSQPVAEET